MRRFLLRLSLCTILPGCDVPSSVAHEDPPPAFATPDSTEQLTGDVLVTWSPSTGDLVAAVDVSPSAGAPDGRLDRLYVLQRRGFGRPAEPFVMRNATVTYRPGLVVLQPTRGSGIALVLDDEKSLGIEAEVRRRPLLNVWTGFGLARKSGAFKESLSSLDGPTLDRLLPVCGGSSPMRLVRTAGALATPRWQATAPPDAPLICDSGGAGSTSCSTSCGGISTGKTCSVSCGTGYHACCDFAQCKCQCVAG
jgi:hypothetical protein